LSFFTKLLTRTRTALARSKTPSSKAGDLQGEISKTINDALVSAGLLPQSPLPPAQAEEPAHRPGRTVPLPGTFVEHSFAHVAGKRRYKLYVPARYSAGSPIHPPLLLMLHGCTQSPDDFAAGTRMNELAEQHGFLVAYPAQSANANGSKCWNWFRPDDQVRGSGEPALLAALAENIVLAYAADPKRVYVAGLSAGAAMAVILGATYPDVFAAVGSHSGLPYRAAHDVPSAFAVMSGSHVTRDPMEDLSTGMASFAPLIAFQGDRDRTVAPSNAEALVSRVIREAAALSPEGRVSRGEGIGRSYTRTAYTTAQGDPLVEFWQIHGAGHAWSGGSPAGSYTDPQGPDASAEMVRFFLQVSARGLSAAA
jgi:poly(hydroxyalkanoate) depolymerase family esterase